MPLSALRSTPAVEGKGPTLIRNALGRSLPPYGPGRFLCGAVVKDTGERAESAPAVGGKRPS